MSHNRQELLDETTTGDNLANTVTTLLGEQKQNTSGRDRFEVPTESITDLLTMRYGFYPASPWSTQDTEGREWLASSEHSKLYRTLGHWNRSGDLSSNELERLGLPAIVDFVATLKRKDVPPAAISDLNPLSPIRSYAHIYDTLTVRKYEERTTSRSGKSMPKKWYMLETMGGQKLETANHGRLMTDLAINVLHIRRGGFGETADDIMTSLLIHGITIRVLRAVSAKAVYPTRNDCPVTIGSRSLGIGIKPHNVKLGKEDYNTYAQIRDDLLSGPAGILALMEGGIMWRLAINTRSIDDINTSLRTETEDDLSYETSTRTSEYDGTRYVEHVLNEQDSYIIAGVYRVLLEGKKQSHVN